jgi:Viral BACON domain
LTYNLQPGGGIVGLELTNAPPGNVPVGFSGVIRAEAGYANGLVDVTQSASYAARSGTSAVFSVGPGGNLTANGQGVDWLDVSYGGVTASAQIAVGLCNYTLSPTNQTVSSNGGPVSVQVTTGTGCSWTAALSSGNPWLTLTSATSTGSGTINLTAAANTASSTQTAFVYVAGQDSGVVLGQVGTDFSLGTTNGGSASQTVTAGQTAMYRLQVNPIEGFAGQVNLTCSGAPASAICSINSLP